MHTDSIYATYKFQTLKCRHSIDKVSLEYSDAFGYLPSLQVSLEKDQRQRIVTQFSAGMASFVIFVVVANLVILGEATRLNSTCVPENANLTNWAANVVYGRDCLQEAVSVKEVKALVRSDKNMKVIGTRHCFNTISDTKKIQIFLLSLYKVVKLDAKARTVTVDAGITYTQLCPYLDSKGFALPNLASFTDLTVAGAISTATHGSGIRNGNLATAVATLELVTAKGEVQKFSRKHDGVNLFRGVVVGVGALGVITRITLDVQPTYTIRQWVYENLTLHAMSQHFDEMMSSGYSVSLFTDWQNGRIRQLWIKSRVGHSQFAAPKKYFGATLATKNLNPEGLSPENNTEQMGIPGPWYLRLPHFRPSTTAKVGHELQSEYFLPREHAVDAILAVEKLRDEIGPHLYISEIRVVKSDKLWISTASGRESVTIHFTWKKDQAAVLRLLPMIERELAPFRPRPHWGKLFTMAPAKFQSTYGKLDDFVRLATKFDPEGKFRNQFLDTNVFSPS